MTTRMDENATRNHTLNYLSKNTYGSCCTYSLLYYFYPRWPHVCASVSCYLAFLVSCRLWSKVVGSLPWLWIPLSSKFMYRPTSIFQLRFLFTMAKYWSHFLKYAVLEKRLSCGIFEALSWVITCLAGRPKCALQELRPSCFQIGPQLLSF